MARRRWSTSIGAFSEIFGDGNLRNLQLSLAANWTGENGYLVALAVYAYDVGGALAVGLVGLGRLLPAGVVALFGSAVADRYRREQVLRVLYALRTVAALASAFAFFAGAPAAAVFVLGASVTVISAALRPAYWALLPSLARTPEQLCAANVAASTSEGLSLLAGPALGGALLAATDAGAVFAAGGVLFLVSTLLSLRMTSGVAIARPQRRNMAREALEGVREVAGHRDTALLFALGGAQTFVRGALTVLVVVAALQLLDMGEAGVGWLNSAFGVGNLVGAVAAVTLVGRRRFAGPLVAGLMLWGAPIALIGIWPNPVAAILLLALPGWGNAIFDIAILTMLQRTTRDEMLGRVFGVLETTVFASMAAGAIAASGLVAALGERAALVLVGMLLPVLAALTLPALRGIDDRSRVPQRELTLLRQLPIFSGLPAVALEHLAAKLVPVRIAARRRVFRKGDVGDRFYLIATGQVDVRVDRRRAATLSVGDCFGEIALLRNVPRTATVVARSDVELFALERDDFLAAISRHEQAACAADETADQRLSALER